MIDRKFITALEGGLRLTGSVPQRNGAPIGRSGVTIADGVDLGQHSPAEFVRLGLGPSELTKLLGVYVGVRGEAAAKLLAAMPLRLTADQAKELSAAVHAAGEHRLRAAYDAAIASGAPSFDEIPDEAATVIASVAYQYGDLAKECPKFWHASTAHDWGAVIAELENFGDEFPTRRYNEADYLRGMMLA